MIRDDLEKLRALRERLRALSVHAYECQREAEKRVGLSAPETRLWEGRCDAYNASLVAVCDTMVTLSRPRGKVAK